MFGLGIAQVVSLWMNGHTRLNSLLTVLIGIIITAFTYRRYVNTSD